MRRKRQTWLDVFPKEEVKKKAEVFFFYKVMFGWLDGRRGNHPSINQSVNHGFDSHWWTQSRRKNRQGGYKERAAFATSLDMWSVLGSFFTDNSEASDLRWLRDHFFLSFTRRQYQSVGPVEDRSLTLIACPEMDLKNRAAFYRTEKVSIFQLGKLSWQDGIIILHSHQSDHDRELSHFIDM